ncbi:CHAP domain-containing protein, partial [Bifidobacterium adolescentis]|uniref:CHAP domain-containing protein n=1 Tax=Bifidobacterium adolescentis TaxID=1680 RepID=UPI0035BC0C5C
DPHGGQSSAQAVSGSTGSTNVVGMSEKDAEAWFNGQQGPNNLCVAYAYGQCTWWTCMRAKKLGWKNIGQYWGNGQDWARSAAAAGYKTTTDAPVA